MTINSLQMNESTVVGGLGTQTFNVAIAGLYTVEFKSFIPYKASGMPGDSSVTTGGSSLQVVVNLNGVAKLTVANPSPTQPVMGGSVRLQCAVNDVITVVLSSSAPADNALNAIKSIINLYQGE